MATCCRAAIDGEFIESFEAGQAVAPTGNIGLILVDHNVQIVGLNQRARQMLANGLALCNRKSLLSAPNGYHQALTDAVLKVIRDTSSAREVILMRLPQLRLPVALAIQSHRSGNAAVAVIVSDPNLACVPDLVLLRALYGLTPAEMRVACALTTGQSIAQVARAQNVAPGTVRTHLKRVFQKTGCRRQCELITILLTAPVHTAAVPVYLAAASSAAR
jgi:DNA-binding CsgD family transcriptional regulator